MFSPYERPQPRRAYPLPPLTSPAEDTSESSGDWTTAYDNECHILPAEGVEQRPVQTNSRSLLSQDLQHNFEHHGPSLWPDLAYGGNLSMASDVSMCPPLSTLWIDVRQQGPPDYSLSTQSEGELLRFLQATKNQLDAIPREKSPFAPVPFLTGLTRLSEDAELDFRCSPLPTILDEEKTAGRVDPSSNTSTVYSRFLSGSSDSCIDPPVSDMSPTDSDMMPCQTHLKNPDHLYMPLWIRGSGKEREGWCGACRPGVWLSLKKSTYWYHKHFVHGVTVSGERFSQPLDIRPASNSRATEGLCRTYEKWINLGRGRRRGTGTLTKSVPYITHKVLDADLCAVRSYYSQTSARCT